MVKSDFVDALSDPTRALLDFYHPGADIDAFPASVAAHFAHIFASNDAFSEIPSIYTVDPRQNDRRLVSFRAMIQDTSPSPEMYLAKRSGARCGGWGLADDATSDDGLDYADLRENTVVWAVSVPGESDWVSSEIDATDTPGFTRLPESHPFKFPVSGAPHLGVQVKIYDTSRTDLLKSTDIVTLVGILTMEIMTSESESPNAIAVPTLHVLFSRPIPLTVVPRVFPYSPSASTCETLRDQLISWIADEGLAGDEEAAEWVLLNTIAKVQSRTPPLLPLSLTLSKFPPPPASKSSTPRLSAVLSHLLPIVVTLPLSLEVLNNSSFSPESKNEDLHSGRLQLPRGSVCVVTEGGVTEGGVFDRGLRNLRALQEVMSSQSLEYIFPFSRFAFETDIAFLILSEGRKSAFFQTNVNVQLKPNEAGELYGSIKEPSPETLAMFRDFVGGAKIGNVTIGENVAEYIQEDFVAERKAAATPAGAVTSDDLIHRMMVARLLTISLHKTEVTTDIWERTKAMEAARRARLT
ncbi:putative alanine racemase-domain-containing protein [Mycena alexandri]|uniref:Alanine racemase-domain-containing protein n=1 Tax=Mycena alexandri TaxID=1745969 RepID=A0AAD6XCV4_9AGAR|nr:putative alanine racemase-domain-containing protein [Mycena alexandri]